ncbi:MAG: hypothetical protein ACJAQT_004044 [Akkermansiaceae bacterium]|jgi:hypothetical protein
MSLPFVALAKNGGDEVGGFKDLEVALGGVVAFGAVDDGLTGGVPSDRVRRLRLTLFLVSRRRCGGRQWLRCGHSGV